MELSKPTARIGDILSECGLVSPDDLQRGLELANRERLRLGEALIRLGVLSEDMVTWALGVQFQLSYVDLDEDMIDWELLNGLPIERLRSILLLPLGMVDGAIHAVIADPTVEGRIETIKQVFRGQNVVVELASAPEIAAMLDKAAHFHPKVNGFHGPAADRSAASSKLERWLALLDSGRLDRIVICPCPARGGYKVQGGSDPDEDYLFESDFKDVLALLPTSFTLVHSAWGADFWLRPAIRNKGRWPIRALQLTGAFGSLLAFEPIPPQAGLSESNPHPHVLMGPEPVGIKALVYGQAAALATEGLRTPSEGPCNCVAIEAHIDFFTADAFQISANKFKDRLALLRWVAAVVRPAVLICEAESAEEIETLAREPLASEDFKFLIILRSRITKSAGYPLPAGTKRVFLSSAAEEAEKIEALLRNGKH